MSMSGFERSKNDKERDVPSLFINRPGVPDDFTEEDLAFATELHNLFSLEQERLPPYYVQTLLDVDDQRFEPVVRGFEYKTSARVFRRLKLRRRLFCAHTTPFTALSTSINDISFRRSALAMVCTFMLVMLLTVAFTGSSFALGVALLLRGPHGSGVLVTNKFPVNMVHTPYNDSPESSVSGTRQISLLAAQQQLHFPIYWPEYTLPQYTLQHINFYIGLDQQWADGPMLEFEYSLPHSMMNDGSGEVWVREFLPRTDVLQLVEEGAAIPIDKDNDGALAIYVDGQWNPDASGGPVWAYGGRSELIYQINGVVFWIAGDQRDGIGEKELMRVAQGLALYSVAPHIRVTGDTTAVTQTSEDNPGPFSTDVIITFQGDSGDGDGSYYVSVTSSQPPKNAY